MLSLDQFRALTDQLIAATDEGRVRWSDTMDDDTFRADFKNGAIELRMISTHEGHSQPHADYKLSVLNEIGRVVDTHSPASGVDSTRCQALFEKARRSARGSEDIVKRIFEELKSLNR